MSKTSINQHNLVSLYASILSSVPSHINARGFSLLVEQRGNSERKKGVFHPSTVGYCPRKIFFDNILGDRVKEPIEKGYNASLRIFLTGHLSHASFSMECIIASYLINSGEMKVDGVKEFHVLTQTRDGKIVSYLDVNPGLKDPIDYSEITLKFKEYNIHGNCDMACRIVCDDGTSIVFIVENKTTNDSSFTWIAGDPDSEYGRQWASRTDIGIAGSGNFKTNFKSPKGPRAEHFAQAQLYIRLLQELGVDECQYAIVMYNDKNNSEQAYFCVPHHKELTDTLLEKIQYVEECTEQCSPPVNVCVGDEVLKVASERMSANKNTCKNTKTHDGPHNRSEVVLYNHLAYTKCSCGMFEPQFKCKYCKWYSNFICGRSMYMEPLGIGKGHPLAFLSNIVVVGHLPKVLPFGIMTILNMGFCNITTC